MSPTGDASGEALMRGSMRADGDGGAPVQAALAPEAY